MNDLMIFKNDEFGQIRSIEINNEPYFIGKDIAIALGYERTDNAIRQHVDEEDKLTHQINASGQRRNMTLINESGLYSLIMSSKLSSAKKFKRWVTNEVLPNIRKNGAYLTEQKIEEVLSNPDTIIKLATDLKREREEKEKLNLQVNQSKQIIGELKPKADYTDRILKSKSTMTVTAIAKDYGMSAIEFNKKLHELNIQYKQSGQWFLYEKYQRCGYTHSKTTEYKRNDGTVGTKLNTEWTQKGRLFLYERLKENNIIPLIERE